MQTVYSGKRRFVLEETFASSVKLYFFDANADELMQVINVVADFNRWENYNKRGGGDGIATLYIAAEFLRVHDRTESEEELFIGLSMQDDDGLDIRTCTAAEAIKGLEAWKENLQ
jgi:hypothetical protein